MISIHITKATIPYDPKPKPHKMKDQLKKTLLGILCLAASSGISDGFEILSKESATATQGMKDDTCAFFCLVPGGAGDCTEPFTPGNTITECKFETFPCGRDAVNLPCLNSVGHTFLKLAERKKNDACEESTSLNAKCNLESNGYCVKTEEMICYNKEIAPAFGLFGTCFACSAKPTGNPTFLGTRLVAEAPVDYCN